MLSRCAVEIHTLPVNLFFFAKTVKKDVSKSSHKNAPTKLRAQVTGVANHLGRGRRGPVRAKAAPTLQQRQCERLGSAVSQDGRLPECPRLLGPTAEDWRLPSRFGLGQLADKLGGFVRPPASHFGAQDNQSGAAIAPMELRVRVSLRRLAVSRAAPSTLAHRGCGVPSRRSGETNVVSTASWAPWKSGNPSTTTSILRLSNGFGAARSMSWTLTFVDTRPPASLQTRAAADSNAKPLEPNTPATAHAARWWPLESSGRPHRQERLDKGRGSQRRRNRSTRNGWGSKRA